MPVQKAEKTGECLGKEPLTSRLIRERLGKKEDCFVLEVQSRPGEVQEARATVYGTVFFVSPREQTLLPIDLNAFTSNLLPDLNLTTQGRPRYDHEERLWFGIKTCEQRLARQWVTVTQSNDVYQQEEVERLGVPGINEDRTSNDYWDVIQKTVLMVVPDPRLAYVLAKIASKSGKGEDIDLLTRYAFLPVGAAERLHLTKERVPHFLETYDRKPEEIDLAELQKSMYTYPPYYSSKIGNGIIY